MKRALASLLLLTGCGSSNPVNQDGGGGGYVGGTLPVPKCGYSVTTRDGALAPELGSAKLGPDPTPWAIHLGLASDPSTSIVVSWRTTDETTLATTVQFGEAGKTDQSTDGLTFAYETANRDPVRMHETHLCGLKPETLYSYRVGGKDAGGSEKWSEVFTFRTAPDKANMNAAITVAVIGDTRGGYATWGAMLKQAQQVGTPDLILFSGDAVTLGPLQSEWDEWFKQGESVLRQVPMVGAHGNHDVNSINYFSQFALPGDEEYFGLDYGPVHVTVANDTPLSAADITTKGPPFLEKDFAASEMAPWKIFLHHRPMYSAAATHGGDMALLNSWGPAVDKHKIDLVLNGHDHDYERSKPMRAQQPQASAANGTIFVVAGSAGAPLYEAGMGAWTEVSAKAYNFAIVKLRRGMLDFKAYDDKGTVIDMLTITK